MRAIVYDRYGGPERLEMRDIPAPTPKRGEVLVRVRAAGVSAGDLHLLRASWFAVRLYQGLFRPKRRVLGWDLSGVVEAVGPAVTRFRPGDEVFGTTVDGGCFAELAVAPERLLVPKPPAVPHPLAAATPVSALTALEGLRDRGGLRAGQRVLVVGASGGVGTFAVQLARHLGAEVTAVASGAKLDLVRSLGAAHAVDYRREDYTRLGPRFDLVLDNVGDRPLAACLRLLRPEGRYVAVSGAPLRSLRIALTPGRRAVAFVSKPTLENLRFLAELLASGALRPALDGTAPLAELPAALHRLAAGEVRGKAVVTAS